MVRPLAVTNARANERQATAAGQRERHQGGEKRKSEDDEPGEWPAAATAGQPAIRGQFRGRSGLRRPQQAAIERPVEPLAGVGFASWRYVAVADDALRRQLRIVIEQGTGDRRQTQVLRLGITTGIRSLQ